MIQLNNLNLNSIFTFLIFTNTCNMKYFYEDILRRIWEFGPWQKVWFLFSLRPVFGQLHHIHRLRAAPREGSAAVCDIFTTPDTHGNSSRA